MGTNIRSKISKMNKFYISNYRYLELKNYCLQYPEWKHEIRQLDGFSSRSAFITDGSKPTEPGDPTFNMAARRERFDRKIDMINSCALNAADNDPDLAAAIIKAVTEGLSWDKICAMGLYNCPKDHWYNDIYRKFFWLLDFARD